MKFGQFIITFSEKFDQETSSRPFLNFKESSVKRNMRKAGMLIWNVYSDSFAITYLI